jgi:NitT/TauT family transport system substrate-binding protein/putative hydroxymethylpyrimidine transport system substrate-binding protein
MSRAAASLAAVLVALGLAACDENGAEPGASREATLVLDFVPNAVHAGIYAALAERSFAAQGITLEVREPSASSDAPKLLAAGRTDFAVMDIHDVGIAREEGFDVRIVAPLVQRPLAAVIAGGGIDAPADLEGTTVGVTGLPSDDAVLDAVLEAGDLGPDAVRRVTIGFDSVPALASGRVDAVTAFWNAEGVALERRDVPTREFRVDSYGAPRYPELVVVTSAELAGGSLARGMAQAVQDGYESLLEDPRAALGDLLEANPGLDRAEQLAQLDALLAAQAFNPPGAIDLGRLAAWAEWDLDRGLLSEPVEPAELIAR